MGLSGGGMLLGGKVVVVVIEWLGMGEGWRSDEVAAAWRRGWNLLVILDFFRGIFLFLAKQFLGEKQEMFSWGDFSVRIEDVSQLRMANVLFRNEESEKSSP